MKNLKVVLLIVFIQLTVVKLHAQNFDKLDPKRAINKSINTNASVINSPKENYTPNSIIQTKNASSKPKEFNLKVLTLTNNDEILTEKVLYHIKKELMLNPKDIVNDSEYERFSKENKSQVIKESEVLHIINSLKK